MKKDRGKQEVGKKRRVNKKGEDNENRNQMRGKLLGKQAAGKRQARKKKHKVARAYNHRRKEGTCKGRPEESQGGWRSGEK